MNFYVNGNVWKLEFVNPNDEVLINDEGIYTLGVTDNNVKTVYINNRLNSYMYRKVLSHEITHVVIFESGINFDRDTEEIIADFIASYGTDVINIIDSVYRQILQMIS